MAIVPAIIVGVVAYFLISSFLGNEENRRKYHILKETKAQALPTRLAAYERLTLFLERIKPNSLLVRTSPENVSKAQYENMLVASIEQEYDHNIAQQIYVTDDCWNVVRAAKNSTIQKIRQIALSDKTQTADELRNLIINEFMDGRVPSETALSVVRKEVMELL
ncbi:hypothetical protein EJ995_10900 [Nonlabens ponticola]|uniref:Uncharacterized protein n=1 Tax=Nonlabens ponticola TaxID=2496866 RepID=A0A3S9N134_9FLAO|nr:hypothetical protein EJ995_10900 [Nonlabens ponticola]